MGLTLTTFARGALAGPEFAAKFLSFDVNDGAFCMASGDLNGDGVLDLAVGSLTVDSVSVLLGRGDGTFDSKVDYDLGARTRSIRIGDMNADGSLDLITANVPDSTVAVLLGQGDGTFAAAVRFKVGNALLGLAIGDVNGDGNLDAVTANGLGLAHSVSVLLGNGDGSLGTPESFDTGDSPWSVALVDLDGDGNLDVATANHSVPTVSVLLGNGDGSFAAYTKYATAENPVTVVAGDLTGDGHPDLVIGESLGVVEVFPGKGDGTFAPSTDYAMDQVPWSIALGDISGDGWMDIVAGNYNGDNPPAENSRISVFLNTGDGTFQPKVTYATGRYPAAVVIGDLNRDGNPDVATANYSGTRTVSVLLGNGDGTFPTTPDFETGEGPNSLAARDLNGDGLLDLVTANWTDNSVSILMGDGHASFGRTDYPTGPSPRSVVVEDVNGDGNPDVLTPNSADNTVSVLLGSGDGTFSAKQDYETNSGPSSLTVEDIDMDGDPDLVTVNLGHVDFSVLLGNGDGTFATRTDYKPGYSATFAAIADVDEDGKPDLLLAGGLQPRIAILPGNGDGTFGAPETFETPAGPASITVRDVNEDGLPDLLVPNYQPGQSGVVSVFLGNGDGTFQPRVDYAMGVSPVSTTLEDLDGDGNRDLVTLNGSFAHGTVSVLHGNGDGTFGPKRGYGTGVSPSGLAIGDVSGDGRPDIMTSNASDNTVSLLLNLGREEAMAAAVNIDPNVINLKSRAPWVTAVITIPGVDPARIDASSVRLAGLPPDSKFAEVGDADADGMADLMVKFSRDALDPLLTPGVNTLEVTGALVTGEPFAGTDAVRVISPGSHWLMPVVTADAQHPLGTIAFATTRAEQVSVRLFDLQGRLVRTLLPPTQLAPGTQAVSLDDGIAAGGALASGIYFYRVKTDEGSAGGRITVLR